jgi:hypothetical protein
MIKACWIVLALAFTSALALADDGPDTDAAVRILSWNISDDAFVAEPEIFQSLLRWADPDIVLLDEVSPSADIAQLRVALEGLRPGENETWHISVGASGGRQRDAIASRKPQEALPEFSSMIPYPDVDQTYILEHMSDLHRSFSDFSMDEGIPAHAAIVITNGRRLLIVVVDLQCCGDGPDGWPEYRRQVEAREIRRRIEQVLERTAVDGLIIAGDFNLVHGSVPAAILNKPYRMCHEDLRAAELYHPDNVANWTWDGRGMPFPFGILDFQFYCPESLELRSGFILDTESLAPDALEKYGLESDSSTRTGRHRPLIAEYGWK